MRRWLFRSFALLVLLGLGAGAAWYFLGPVTVEVAHARRGPAVEAVYGSGTIEPTVMLPIAPKVVGRLQRLLADEGDRVREGQALAELDDRELAASVAEWEARVRYGEVQFRRASDLYKSRVGSQAALDQARNELDTARAARDRVKTQLAEMSLTAPADGIVIRRDGEIGELMQPGRTIFWMSCCDALRITAEIDEEDIRAVKPGQKVLARADAFPDQVFEGTVAEITPKGDPVARSFRVRIRLPADTPLMIGMTVDCNIVVVERRDALLIPATAVIEGRVWVVQGGRASTRNVTLGVSGDQTVEVKAGLSDDDLVIARPADGLREGRAVRIGAPG